MKINILGIIHHILSRMLQVLELWTLQKIKKHPKENAGKYLNSDQEYQQLPIFQ